MAPSQNTFDTCSCARVRVKSAIFSTVDVLDQPFPNLWYCQPKDMQVIPDHEDQRCGGAPLLGLAAFRPAPGTSFFPDRQTRCHALRVAMVPPRVRDGRMSSTAPGWPSDIGPRYGGIPHWTLTQCTTGRLGSTVQSLWVGPQGVCIS